MWNKKLCKIDKDETKHKNFYILYLALSNANINCLINKSDQQHSFTSIFLYINFVYIDY